MTADRGETCTWCGAPVEPSGGFRAHEASGERYAVFCRLEHLVPWELQGAHWEAAPAGAAAPELASGGDEGAEQGQGACSHCEAPLDEIALALVRHRGEHRIADGFCSTAHMAAWAKAGGRWQ
jgi:hypothetical protein